MVVQWDERNLRHLLLDNGWRNISPGEVEEVLANPNSERRRLRDGRRRYRGATSGGRRLVVVVEVPAQQRLRPLTAWETRS